MILGLSIAKKHTQQSFQVYSCLRVSAKLYLPQIGSDLYDASDAASSKGDLSEAALLQSVADKLYEDAENLDILISEMEEQ